MNKRMMASAVCFLAIASGGCNSEAGPSTGGLGTEAEGPCMEVCADYGTGALVCPCDAVPDIGPALDAGDPYQQ